MRACVRACVRASVAAVAGIFLVICTSFIVFASRFSTVRMCNRCVCDFKEFKHEQPPITRAAAAAAAAAAALAVVLVTLERVDFKRKTCLPVRTNNLRVMER